MLLRWSLRNMLLISRNRFSVLAQSFPTTRKHSGTYPLNFISPDKQHKRIMKTKITRATGILRAAGIRKLCSCNLKAPLPNKFTFGRGFIIRKRDILSHVLNTGLLLLSAHMFSALFSFKSAVNVTELDFVLRLVQYCAALSVSITSHIIRSSLASLTILISFFTLPSSVFLPFAIKLVLYLARWYATMI